MAHLLTLGWTGEAALPPDRRRLGMAGAIAAAALIVAQAAVGVFEQARIDGAPEAAKSSGGSQGSSIALGRETVIGAYTGAPYNYPSPAHVTNPLTEGATDFTIDKVDWYTAPFKSPIYYGARVAQWFSGGAVGTGLDFIHSKAIAPLDDEAGFKGTIDGQPLPAQARIKDIVSKLEFSHGHNMLLLNGFVRLPGIGPRISPYAGLGGGVLLPHTEFQLANNARPRTYEYNYAGPAGQALLGVEIRLAKLSFFVEYKFTYADYDAPLSEVEGSWLPLDLFRQAQRWWSGNPPPGGHIATEVVSHQVVSGISVRIAPAR